MLRTIVALLKSMGAPSENASERDGAFSYHAETHAAGAGLAAGFFATAAGDARLLGLVLGAAVYGSAQYRTVPPKRHRIVVDIAVEWHYAVPFAVVGALLGAATKLLVGPIDIPVL